MEHAPADGRSAIFGAARPVDTASREQEIEEKLKREKEKAAEEEEVCALTVKSFMSMPLLLLEKYGIYSSLHHS